MFLLPLLVVAVVVASAWVSVAEAATQRNGVDTQALTAILEQGITDRVYTGAVAVSGDIDGNILYSNAVGHYHYIDDSEATQGNPSVTTETRFDLASVSKVFATTSAMALLYQHGLYNLDDKISKYLGPKFDQGGKDAITIRHCLLHNSGLQPDPTPWYWDPAFGCPQTSMESPQEDFSCMDHAYESFLAEVVQQAPGEKYVYSDIGFMTLHMVIGHIVETHKLIDFRDLRSECQIALNSQNSYKTPGVKYSCNFEAFVRLNVFSGVAQSFLDKPKANLNEHWLPRTQYLLPSSLYSEAMPTLNDTGSESYTHGRIQGRVSDGDCFAIGGFCGHAGVFSTALDVGKFLNRLLRVTNGEKIDSEHWIDTKTMNLFITEYNSTQSSRALGWTINDPNVADYGYDNSCGAMSVRTFMHTGYTGTCVCVDPVNKVWSVILTNRVYNCQGQLCAVGSSSSVKAIYKSFHNKIMESVI